MATKVIMPKQGLQMTEGTILQWFKKEGDTVKEGEPLFEMETDKLTIEIDAPAGGTILKIFNREGDTVPITEVIAVIGENGEDISEIVAEPGKPEQSNPSLNTVEPESAAVPNASDSSAEAAGTPVRKESSGRVFSSPRARLRADERGVGIENIQGSGPEGLVIERDVINADVTAAATPLAKRIAQKSGVSLSGIQGSGPRGKIYSRDLSTAEAGVPSGGIVRKPLKGMRKVIARRMRSSLDTAAQATHNVDVDMTEAVRLREHLKDAGIKVSYNDIILKTAAEALKLMPELNCSLQGDEILFYSDVNIGIAVALEDGLIVPVLNFADRKNLALINDESRELGEKAKSGNLTDEELRGATFTVSNLGMYGLDSFTAIINEPESGILAVGAIKDKPVVVNKQLEVRPVCNLTLTYDHRVIDGAPAAEFLMLIKSILENPYRLI